MAHLYNAQNERGTLKVVLEAEVNLADVLGGLCVVDVHVHERDGSALQEGLLRREPGKTMVTYTGLFAAAATFYFHTSLQQARACGAIFNSEINVGFTMAREFAGAQGKGDFLCCYTPMYCAYQC